MIWKYDARAAFVAELRRQFLAVTLAALASSPAFATPSEEFSSLVHRHDEVELQLYPSNAIQRSDRRFADRFEDNLTAAHLERERHVVADERARLKTIERGALSEQDRLSYDILDWQLATRAQELAAPFGEMRQEMPLDQFGGAHLTFAREIEWRAHNPFVAAKDYDTFLLRMHGFVHWVDTAIAQMREGAAKGVTLPRVIAQRVLSQVAPLARQDLETGPFMGPVRAMPVSVKGPERRRVAAAWRAGTRELIAAYGKLTAFLKDEYIPKARANIGMSALANGRALYLQEVHERTTLDFSPDAIHALGLKELARISREMNVVKDQAGFSGTLDAFITYLRTDPKFKFATPAAFMADLQRARRTALARVGALFLRLPKTRLEIRLYEPFLAPVKSAAEYSALSADLRRPGIVYANDYDLPSRPAYTTDVMIAHEGLPGHHLQIAIAVENSSLPAFRRFGGPSAFLEGWAMYAETLGSQIGLYRTPYQKFGALAYDAWRSARLVVDTGIHWKGWSERQAIDFFRAHTALSDTEITAEVEREIAIPAQALAYKLGQRDFLRLRERAQTMLGPRFDLRRFHDELIRDGPMPLPILDEKMERWMAAQKRRD